MKILSWNCHYGLTQGKVEKLLEEKAVDIFLIQECRKKDLDFFNIGFGKYWYGDSLESSGNAEKDLGVAIFAKIDSIEIYEVNWASEMQNYRYVFPIKVKKSNTNEEYLIFNIWTKALNLKGKKNKKYHEPVYRAFDKKYLFETEDKVIFIGDFNTGSVLNTESEKWYVNLKSFFDKYGFINCANEKEFNPTYFKGNGYWLDDHCFTKMNNVKRPYFELGKKDDWISDNLSDHIPLFIQID